MANCAYKTININVPAGRNINPIILTENPFQNSGTYPLNIIGRYNIDLPRDTYDEETINNFTNSLLNAMADVHPKTGSPLIGHGYYEVNVTPSADYEGVSRANPPTIGAYETTGQ